MTERVRQSALPCSENAGFKSLPDPLYLVLRRGHSDFRAGRQDPVSAITPTNEKASPSGLPFQGQVFATQSCCGGALLPIGGGGGVVPFGFESSCPVLPGGVVPGFVVPGVELLGLVLPGLVVFGEVVPGFVPFGAVVPRVVLPGGFVPGVVVFGVASGLGGLFGFVWGFVLPVGGVAVLPGGVAVPADRVAALGFELCPAVPELPAGAYPLEGEL